MTNVQQYLNKDKNTCVTLPRKVSKCLQVDNFLSEYDTDEERELAMLNLLLLDETPTEGSTRLVNSGDLAKTLNNYKSEVNNVLDNYELRYNSLLDSVLEGIDYLNNYTVKVDKNYFDLNEDSELTVSNKLFDPEKYSGLGKYYFKPNIQEVVPYKTWCFRKLQDGIFLLFYGENDIYSIVNNTEYGLVLRDTIVDVHHGLNVLSSNLNYVEQDGIITVTLPDGSTITNEEINNSRKYVVSENGTVNKNIISEFPYPNTMYYILYDFDLNGAALTIPENCILIFDGGSISNGTLIGNETILFYILEEEDVLHNVDLLGDFIVNSGSGGVDKKDNVNGMAILTLRKNKNPKLLITKNNTIYRVVYDFDLNEEVIDIPENCILQFDGGSLSHGTIVGNNTVINSSPVLIFGNDLIMDGTWATEKAYAEWFGNDTDAIQKSLDIFRKWDLLTRKRYYATKTIHINSDYTKIRGNSDSSIKCDFIEGVLFLFAEKQSPNNFGPFNFEMSDVNITFICHSLNPTGVIPDNRVTCFKAAQSIIDGIFRNIRIYGAYKGFDFSKVQKTGDSVWNIYYENVRMSGCHIMYELNGYGAIQHSFNRCYFDAPTEGQIEGIDKEEPGVSVILDECETVVFTNCNFGGEYSSNHNKTMRFLEVHNNVSQVKFVGCNFETGFAPDWDSTTGTTIINGEEHKFSNTWKNGLFAIYYNFNNVVFDNCYFLFYKYLNRIFQNADGDITSSNRDAIVTAYENGKYSKLITVGSTSSLEIKNCRFDLRGNTSNRRSIPNTDPVEYKSLVLNYEKYANGVPTGKIVTVVEDIVLDLGCTNIVIDNYSRQFITGGNFKYNLGSSILTLKEDSKVNMDINRVCAKNDKIMPRHLLCYNSENDTLNYLKYDPYEIPSEEEGKDPTRYLGHWIRTNKLIKTYDPDNEILDVTVGDACFDYGYYPVKPIYYHFDGSKNFGRWLDANGYPRGHTKGSSAYRSILESNLENNSAVNDYGFQFYDSSIVRPVWVRGVRNSDPEDIHADWITADGFSPELRVGITSNRPNALKHKIYVDIYGNRSETEDETHIYPLHVGLTSNDVGFSYFDKTLGKILYVKDIDVEHGTITWVDALGNPPETTYLTTS